MTPTLDPSQRDILRESTRALIIAIALVVLSMLACGDARAETTAPPARLSLADLAAIPGAEEELRHQLDDCDQTQVALDAALGNIADLRHERDLSDNEREREAAREAERDAYVARLEKDLARAEKTATKKPGKWKKWAWIGAGVAAGYVVHEAWP